MNLKDFDKLIRRDLENGVVINEIRMTIKRAEEENSILRKSLWLRHGCSLGNLYGDDGEMQCHHCKIDFKRDSAKDIFFNFEEQGRKFVKEYFSKMEEKGD